MPALPFGTIMLWHGGAGGVPLGWVICDGNNGTPDLRDRFVIGAGSTYNPGSTGGDEIHRHDFTSDGHSHTIVPGTGLKDGTDSSKTTTTAVDTGETDDDSSMPEYYGLYFIMRV